MAVKPDRTLIINISFSKYVNSLSHYLCQEGFKFLLVLLPGLIEKLRTVFDKIFLEKK